MTVDRLINVLVTIALIEMMVAVGLNIGFADLARIAKDARLILRALIANYILVSAITIALLLLFQAPPMAAAGFLILAACPGATFGPPCTKIAKADTAASVGLMVFLAASAALVARVLLQLLWPIVVGGEPLHVDGAKLVGMLLATQLLPFCAGLVLRHWRPGRAASLQIPAGRLSAFLNLAVVVLILATQFRLLEAIPVRAFVGMLLLVIASLAAGWQLFRDGCPGGESPQQVAGRANRVIGRVREIAGNVLLFSSGHFIRVLAARWLGLEPTQNSRYFALSTARLSALGYERDLSRPVIQLWNQKRYVGT